jgi:hypothetical protein
VILRVFSSDFPCKVGSIVFSRCQETTWRGLQPPTNMCKHSQTPMNHHKHLRTLMNIREHLWTPLNTFEHLHTLTNTLRTFSNVFEHLWTPSHIFGHSRTLLWHLWSPHALFATRHDHPCYAMGLTLSHSTLWTLQQLSDVSDVVRYATPDGGSMGLLPHLDIFILLCHMVPVHSLTLRENLGLFSVVFPCKVCLYFWYFSI